MFGTKFFEGIQEDLFLVEEIRRVHDLYLSDRKGCVAADEFFHVVMNDLVRREVRYVGTGFEHFHAVFFDVHTGDVGQFFSSCPVFGSAGRRTEENRVGNDGRQEESGYVFGDGDAGLFIEAGYDRCRAADGLEEWKSGRLWQGSRRCGDGR